MRSGAGEPSGGRTRRRPDRGPLAAMTGWVALVFRRPRTVGRVRSEGLVSARTLMALASLVVAFTLVPVDRAEGGGMCYIVQTSAGPKRVCDSWSASEGDPAWMLTDFEWDCRAGECHLCGVCHAERAKQKPPKAFRTAPHMAKFQYSMKAGEQIPWGHGTHLALIGGRKCIVRDGKPIHCFPAKALVLKDPQGQPVGVLSPPKPPLPAR